MYKIKILPKNDTFFEDIVAFIFEKSPSFKRQLSLDALLDSENYSNNLQYFIDRGPIKVENVFGSTFQSYYRSNENIYAISHDIVSLEFCKNSIYGNIKPTKYGEIIDFNKGILKPVYFRPEQHNSKLAIATFDIDFNIINEHHDSNP